MCCILFILYFLLLFSGKGGSKKDSRGDTSYLRSSIDVLPGKVVVVSVRRRAATTVHTSRYRRIFMTTFVAE